MAVAEDPLTIIQGDALSSLRGLEDESVQCCVTSPPYWGLRDYGLSPIVWGGAVGCEHEWGASVPGSNRGGSGPNGKNGYGEGYGRESERGNFCHCGAWRGCLGLEPTPELFVSHMVEIFRELKRVLRADGTLWLNLGDSYATGGGAVGRCPGGGDQGERFLRAGMINTQPNRLPLPGLKSKDLIGIPWAVAKALRNPYYAGRIKAERDRAWMAAMIDGEGTICGFKHDRKDDGRQRTGINVCVTNANTALLDESYRIWPTSRREHNAHGEGHYGSLPVYRWIVHGTANKLLFLREIYPYLIGKKRQALLAYNLLLFSLDAKRLGKTPQKDSTNAKRARLTELISDANNYRPFDIPDWCVEPPSVFEQGWYLRSDIIWSKPNPMPESVTDRPTKSHEYIFLLSKSERYYYDQNAIAEPLLRPDEGERKTPARFGGADKWQEAQKQSRLHSGNQYLGTPNGTRNKRSVWSVATQPFSEAHFATFPPDLIKPCILAGAPVGGVVIDCFAGSGTTAKVAIELGRKAIAIEPKAEYVEMIKKRCQTTIGLPLAI